MFGARTVQVGRDRVQINPWKSSTTVANLVPFPSGDKLSQVVLGRTMEQLAALGCERAFTAAMSPQQAEAFLQAGFVLHEELHLLRRSLASELPDESGHLRRARRGDWDAVIALDQLAFDEFWGFDRQNLSDAIRATPRHRFQVTKGDVVGYHVTGLAANSGYIQRIAVHPQAQGHGWGRRMLNDAMRWAQRHGAVTAHVNTQISNERALNLYLRNGFVLAPWRLQVLSIDLGDTP